MERLENRYEIKRILKSTDDEYVEALNIYYETTPVDIKTNTNEITHWLDKRTSSIPFELFLFALYLDGKIIGFAMLSYLIKRRIFIYDYIAIKNQYRVNAAYFAYISLINNYINMNGYKTDYVVVEISNKNGGKNPDKESRIFQKLLCMEGFGVIDTLYRTAPLGTDNYESNFEAFLYIKKSGDTMSSITRETVLSIIKGIYFDYYETWYSGLPNFDDIDCFRERINASFKEIENGINEKSVFNVISNECVLPSALKNEERTDGILPAKPIKPYKTITVVFATLLIAPVLIVLVHNWILTKFQIPIDSVNSMIGSVFGAVMSFVIAYFVIKKKNL